MEPPRQLMLQLSELARHERRQRLFWGIACWLLALTVALLICLEIDWLCDLRDDTPTTLRWFLRGSVLTLAAWFGYRWIIQPQLHGFSPEELATWVEKYDPQYRFRLISALQFGSDKPQLRDMSRPLMEAVIREAENQVEHASFSQLLSNQRYKRGAALLVLSTMAWLAYAGLHPVSILLQRLLGSDSAIPRQVQLHASAASLFPQGEPLQLEFTVTGRLPDALEGMVEVQPEGQAAERYPLIPLDTTSPARRYAASLPPSSKPFTYRAWLYDGRLRQRGEAVLVPRPVLRSWEASLILPSYVGTLPDGKPFELPQPKGDLKPVPGAIVRIQITTSKPVTAATAELLGPVLPDLACRSGFPVGPVHLGYLLESQRLQGWTPLSAGPLFLLERIPLPLSDDGMEAQATFSLPVNASAYRIVTTDEHGLTNRPIPRRAITFHPDDLPQVTLLPERFAESNDPADEIDLEGMPVPLGRSIRIGYLVQDDLALDRAVLQFRINEGDWQSLPLTEVKASQPLDERTGAAKNSSSRDQLPFHTAPPSNAASQLGRTTGGGRFDFQTRTLPQLRLGDIIDYRLEVYDRHDDPLRPPGRSVLRRKTVVTEAQFLDWLVYVVQQENRLRQVERQQRKVFEPR